MDTISINGKDTTWADFSRLANLTVRHDLDLRGMPGNFMPSGLTVIGSIDLYQNDAVSRLGNRLRVTKNLDISGSGVDKLDGGLFVGDTLSAFRTLLETFPAAVMAGSVMISGDTFARLPDNWSTRNLTLHKTSVCELPADLVVRGDLHVSNSPLDHIPPETALNGWVTVIDCPLRGGMPGREFVNGGLHIEGTQTRSLGDRLDVAGPCTIERTPLMCLPGVFRVDGDVALIDTPLTRLSRCFMAAGSVDLRRTLIEPRWHVGGDPLYLVEFANGPRIIVGKTPLKPDDVFQRYPKGTAMRDAVNSLLGPRLRSAAIDRQRVAALARPMMAGTMGTGSAAA